VLSLDYTAARTRLVEDLSAEISDRRVLDVMASIPRELFVPRDRRRLAYEDRPLPIGYHQTISQPYIVALMTQALALDGRQNVLEVGTGSGYQAAILSRMARHVVTVERIPELAIQAETLLAELDYNNIEVHLAGDDLGWPKGAPYDAIMVTAGAPKVPADLLTQLAMDGRMVIPVGPRHIQELCLVTRRSQGNTVRNLGGCRFVSLIGRNAWEEEIAGG
jgi:protein-L-isoaspartate(D-aspartate) O-methyltransferase